MLQTHKENYNFMDVPLFDLSRLSRLSRFLPMLYAFLNPQLSFGLPTLRAGPQFRNPKFSSPPTFVVLLSVAS
jgi:hypothetical protein